MSRPVDLLIAYRVIKMLVTPFNKQEAYKLGIIDANGKALKKSKDLNTEAEREAFTLLHRLVFNCKRIMSKIPLVRTKLGTYATALFLLKEHNYEVNDTSIKDVTHVRLNIYPDGGVSRLRIFGLKL